MNTFNAFGVRGSVLSILQILFLFDLHGYSIKVSNFQVSNVKLRHKQFKNVPKFTLLVSD